MPKILAAFTLFPFISFRTRIRCRFSTSSSVRQTSSPSDAEAAFASNDAAVRILSGRSSGVTNGPWLNDTARSTAFSNSRTLPGHRYSLSRAIVSGRNPRTPDGVPPTYF